MADGRMGDVMPLELAMKRELAYRKKVENLLWQLYDGESMEDPFTSQVRVSFNSFREAISPLIMCCC